MKTINEMKLSFPSKSRNEAFARAAVAAFIAALDPTVSELSDLKTAVSEAVTNCIVHGYRRTSGTVYLTGKITEDNRVIIKIRDKGVGIADVKQAMEPLFTTDAANERSGMGFSIMESFSDKLSVSSKKGAGTRVIMTKKLSPKKMLFSAAAKNGRG